MGLQEFLVLHFLLLSEISTLVRAPIGLDEEVGGDNKEVESCCYSKKNSYFFYFFLGGRMIYVVCIIVYIY